MPDRAMDASLQRHARVAGFAYVFIIVIAVVCVGVLDAQLVVPGDDAATVENITATPLLFRVSVAGVVLMYAAVVVLSWALYVVLENVDRTLALLALLLRIAEAIVGGTTVLLSLVVLGLVDGPRVFEPDLLHALVGLSLDVREAGLDVVLFFIGLGGTLFCYLLFRSKYVPRPLAAWGIYTYLTMFVLALMSILWADHPTLLETVFYLPGALLELSLGLWLLIQGVNTQGAPAGDT